MLKISTAERKVTVLKEYVTSTMKLVAKDYTAVTFWNNYDGIKSPLDGINYNLTTATGNNYNSSIMKVNDSNIVANKINNGSYTVDGYGFVKDENGNYISDVDGRDGNADRILKIDDNYYYFYWQKPCILRTYGWDVDTSKYYLEVSGNLYEVEGYCYIYVDDAK